MTLVIKKASGGVAVMRLTGDADAAACIEQWKTLSPGEYVSHAEVPESALPQDRLQRAMWDLVNGAVVINQALAPVPQVVTRRQAKQALRQTLDASGATLLSKVQPAINAILDPLQRDMMQLEWDEALEFVRTRPGLIQMATAIGLDTAGIDKLFKLAATL